MKGREVAVLAVMGILSVAALLAGCGSSSGTNASATDEASAPLSKAQFVKQAGEICQEAAKKKDAAVTAALKELAAQAQKPPTPQESAELVEKTVIPAYKSAVDRLGQLGAPKADEAKVKKLVGEYEAALQDVEGEPAVAAKRNPFVKADAAAKAYGIANCSL